MKNKTKMLSIVLAIVMILTSVSIGVPTFAASKPSATQITSIKAIEKGFKVKWKKKSCTGYQVQYSTSKKFTSKTSKTLKVNKAKTTSKTVKKLKAKKKYYVRVRTYKTVKKKNYYSKWSANYSVTTKAKETSSGSSSTTSSSSATPQIKSVERVKGSTKFKVTFTKVKNAVDYDVYVSNNKSFSDKNNALNVRFDSTTGSSATVDAYDGTPTDAREILTNDYNIKYETRYFKVIARFLDKNYNEKYTSSQIYTYTGPLSDEQEEYPQIMNNAFKEMNIFSSDGDFDKLVKIQRWIDSHWVYGKKESGIYALAKNGVGVCQQFADNFNYFAKKSGLNSYTITSIDEQNHAWNLVRIDNYWYGYDCESTYGNGDVMANRFYTDLGRKSFRLSSYSENLVETLNPIANVNLVIEMQSKLENALYK